MKQPRIVLSRDEWKALRYEVLYQQDCACGCDRPAQSAHHLVRRGGHYQGDDVEENLVPLAGDGTRLCHGALTSAMRTYDPEREEYIEPLAVKEGIRQFIEHERPEKMAYVISRTSMEWLDNNYPKGDSPKCT